MAPKGHQQVGDRRGRGGSIREAERLKRPGACGHVWAESTGHAKRTIHCSTQQKRKDGNRKVWGEFSSISSVGWSGSAFLENWNSFT